MEFTKEAWENAPEGARLEWNSSPNVFIPATLVGYSRSGVPVVECNAGYFIDVDVRKLRIILPKRKVTVQLWRDKKGRMFTNFEIEVSCDSWTLLGEHTFEIEGE